ncbi:hypothetical protein EV175_004231, partial [Coemansia sp. RSA 1933]
APASGNHRSRYASISGCQEPETAVTPNDDIDAPAEEMTPDEPASRLAAAAATTVATRRCRFWPSCSNKNCKYAHPSVMCRMQSNCAYGASCIYIHPSDMNKINAVVTRGNGRRSKRKINELIRYNNLEAYVAQ